MASTPQSERTKRATQAIKANGHKINTDDTVRAWKTPATSELPIPGGRPSHMWIENGNSNAGLQHMQSEKKIKEFAQAGIPPDKQREKLPILAEALATTGRHVGYQGKGDGRPIMSAVVDGKVTNAAITVGNNGFAVGMNTVPTRKIERSGRNPGDVSDKTMKALYTYPPKRIERSVTSQQPKQSSATPDSKSSVVARSATLPAIDTAPAGYVGPSTLVEAQASITASPLGPRIRFRSTDAPTLFPTPVRPLRGSAVPSSATVSGTSSASLQDKAGGSKDRAP